MAKAKSTKGQSIKDAAKEAYLKGHTKEEMYAEYDLLIARCEAAESHIGRLQMLTENDTRIIEKHKKDASNWRVKCNELTLENVSLTLALTESKHCTKVFSVMVGLLIGFSLILLFF